jgi:hypothetical protein
MTNMSSVFSFPLSKRPSRVRTLRVKLQRSLDEDVRGLRLAEQTEVDLEDRLEQAHVGTLVESDLVLPDVDEQNLRASQGKKGRLALKVLFHSAQV